jgi:predicted DNA-binding transcriptional regulator AlpA
MLADDEVLLAPEVAAIVRVEVPTLATWRARGEGPAWFRIGKKKAGYMRSDVMAYLARQQRESAEQQAREHRQAAS